MLTKHLPGKHGDIYMDIRVTEVYFKEPEPPRSSLSILGNSGAEYFSNVVARLAVNIDGERFTAEQVMSHSAAHRVPYEVIMGGLRRQIMGAVEQKLFGDYNRR